MKRKSDLGKDDETYMPPVTSVGYRGEVGDVGLTGSMSKQDKLKTRNLSADYPLGKGKLIAGLADAYWEGEKIGRTKNLGYQGDLGPGKIQAMMLKPEKGGTSANINYMIPFAKGGNVKRKKK